MKAPNKIYVPESKECSGCIDMRIFAEYELKRGIEYIRKDALVEWINKKLQESADRLDYGTNKAYAEILDKLNEM